MRFAALVIVLSSFCFASEHHQANIVGYPVGQYGVKGDIDMQVNHYVVNPLSTELSKAGGGQVVFTVIGSADQTGDSVANERLAKDRANEMATYLSDKFPSAKFAALTKGDERNARMTSVSWYVVEAPPSRSLLAGINFWIIVVVGVVLFGVIILVAKRSGSGIQQSIVPPASSNLRTMPAPTVEIEKTVEVDWKGKIYSILIVRKDGEWVTPFRTKDGQKPITREKEADVVLSIRSFLKRPEARTMINQLIAEGKIKIREVA